MEAVVFYLLRHPCIVIDFVPAEIVDASNARLLRCITLLRNTEHFHQKAASQVDVPEIQGLAGPPRIDVLLGFLLDLVGSYQFVGRSWLPAQGAIDGR